MFTEIIEARGEKIGVNHGDFESRITDVDRCVKGRVELFMGQEPLMDLPLLALDAGHAYGLREILIDRYFHSITV
jgi:hypothetical protein